MVSEVSAAGVVALAEESCSTHGSSETAENHKGKRLGAREMGWGQEYTFCPQWSSSNQTTPLILLFSYKLINGLIQTWMYHPHDQTTFQKSYLWTHETLRDSLDLKHNIPLLDLGFCFLR